MIVDLLAQVLDLVGLSVGQATLGASLAAVAVWARRAVVIGSVAATGVKIAAILFAILAVGVTSGVIAIDVGTLGAILRAVWDGLRFLLPV